MRTLAEMRAKVRKNILDSNVSIPQFTNDEIDEALEISAITLWNNVLASEKSNNILLKAQSPQRFLAQQDIYKIPSDSLGLNIVEFRSLLEKFATLKGGTNGSADAAGFWAPISDGSFRIFTDDTLYDIRDIDFTGVTTMAEVATKIQDALRLVTGGEEEVIFDTDHFEFTAFNRIHFASTVETGLPGTDISLAAALDATFLNGVVTVSSSRPDWFPVDFAPAIHGIHYRRRGRGHSGASALFASPTHGNTFRKTFFRKTAEGFIEFTERPNTSTGIFRIWYYKRPIFPVLDTDKFDTPESTDILVEYLATALLSLEELEETRPIGVYGRMYSAKFAEFQDGQGRGQINRRRRYVGRG